MTQKETGGAGESRLAWLLLAIAVYLLRVMPWAMSEYWYDEVLTLANFVIPPKDASIFETVFRTYPIANNHILSTATYWLWVRAIGYNIAAEYLVRIPSIVEGMFVIVIVSLHWRKRIGDKVAVLGAMMFAISPVFTAFAYQVRGYSLSMLLAVIAISGALECSAGRYVWGSVLAFVSCLLLPLVIPSNALFSLVMAVMLLLCAKDTKHGILLAAVPLIGSAIGGSYYFTIWDQFIEASKEPGGWDSPWNVALNILLAFALHAAVVMVCIPFKGRRSDSSMPKERWLPAAVVACTALTIAAVLLSARSGHAPYPRVFLVFLPAVSFAALFAARNSFLSDTRSMLPIVITLALGLAVERVSSSMTERELARGDSPLNLLQQYYKGSTELRAASSMLARESLLDNCIIMTDEYDAVTLDLYCAMQGKEEIVCSPNKTEQGFAQKDPSLKSVQFLAVAKTPEVAARLLSHAGFGTEQELLANFDDESFPDGMRMTVIGECGTIRCIYKPPLIIKRQQQPPPKTDNSLII